MFHTVFFRLCISFLVGSLCCCSVLVQFLQVAEQNGDEVQEEGQDEAQVEEHDDGHEEAVVVDADSTDGAVLMNSKEVEEEEWGTNDEGNPSD